MADTEQEKICRLLQIHPGEVPDLCYQTIILEGQPIVHVVPGDGTLAYIWAVIDSSHFSDIMAKLVASGEEEQAVRKLETFRLVLATPDVSSIEFEAWRTFREIEEKQASTELLLSELG